MDLTFGLRKKIAKWWHGDSPRLRYFEDVFPVELAAINKRRGDRAAVQPLPSQSQQGEGTGSAGRTPDPEKLFNDVQLAMQDTAPRRRNPKEEGFDPSRPQPVPCTATGLALSGGGIRSAAVCLGALQALQKHGRLKAIDYLSTVSGGGYIGASLSAAMSARGGGAFPFGTDVFDSKAMAHLRNYSNYLLPRGNSGIRNFGEAAAVILRGLVANATVLTAAILFFVLTTLLAFQDLRSLARSFAPALFNNVLPAWLPLGRWIGLISDSRFAATLAVLLLLGLLLASWAVLRSFSNWSYWTDDTRGRFLYWSRNLIVAAVVVAFLDLQPIAIDAVQRAKVALPTYRMDMREVAAFMSALAAFAGGVSAFASQLGKFLHKSRRATRWPTLVLRALTRVLILAAAMIIPLLLWLTYLCLCAWAIYDWGSLELPAWAAWIAERPPGSWLISLLGFVVPDQFARAWESVPIFVAGFVGTSGIALLLNANGYSLHRFYRDRLSKAFLFDVNRTVDEDPAALDDLKLSDLRSGNGPYHLINSAMNVQGSFEANRRGRNADFFMFSRDFVGSDLTGYAATAPSAPLGNAVTIENVEKTLDLATALAISGAAVSANMGSNTIRAMSPTLALLNVRLGYWLRNPSDIDRQTGAGSRLPSKILSIFTSKFYLVAEMLNQLDEKKRSVYLSDGGHIENLGLYELLKRGCGLIVVIDAEADPTMSFESLLKVERYARIDLGVRIILPWEGITREASRVNEAVANRTCPTDHGPHCAVGRIIYANNERGILVYVKSSISGDEKDYILDYKIRNPDFPHETTGDQFFSEEQFEMYRALGFHMTCGVFDEDELLVLEGSNGFTDRRAALDEIETYLPKLQ